MILIGHSYDLFAIQGKWWLFTINIEHNSRLQTNETYLLYIH